MSAPVFNQNHSGSGNNVINYGNIPFYFDEKIKRQISDLTSPETPYQIYVLGVSDDIYEEIAGFIDSLGLNVSGFLHMNTANLPFGKQQASVWTGLPAPRFRQIPGTTPLVVDGR